MYSVNWATKVITIPKADTEFVSSTPDVRQLNVLTLWENLRSIEDDVDGISYVAIVKNTTPITVAGITLGRVVEIINGYTITFEDGQYAVNIYGGNSNIADVTNKNQVSVNTANSAGIVQVGGADVLNQILEGSMTVGDAIRIMLSAVSGKVSGAQTSTITFRDVADTKDRITATVDGNGNRTNVVLDGE